MAKKVKFMCTAFRDGFQSVYGARVFAKDFMPAVKAAYDAGIRWFEAGGGARFQSCFFYSQENAFDVMDEFRRTAPEADLQTLSRGVNVVGLKSQPADMIKLHAELFKKHGMSSIRNFDALNDVENLKWSGECIHNAGLNHEVSVTMMGLPPGCEAVDGAHTPDFYIGRLQRILDARIPFERVCFKDASGTSTATVVYETIKRARKILPGSTHLHFHTHETAGNAVLCYKAALDAGADGIDLSMTPVSGGTCQPDIVTMWHALRGSGFDLDIDVDKIRNVEEVFRDCMAEYMLPPEALAVDPSIIWSPMPGGALTANTQMLRDANMLEHYNDLIAEMFDAVRCGGYGTSVTPVSQFYVQQAFNNMALGKWKKIADGYGRMVLGYFGSTPVPPDPEIVRIAAEQLKLAPTTKTVLEVDNANPKKGRKAAEKLLTDASLPITDENVFIASCCEEKGVAFLKDPKSVPIGVRKNAKAAAAPAAPATPAKAVDGYTVTVNGKAYGVALKDGKATVNGKEYNVAVVEGLSAVSAATPKAAAAGAGQQVKAPVPGIILRMSVANGAAVKAGDELFMMEAMKMEMPINAPCDGVVTLSVALGDRVNTGDVMAVVG